MTAARIVWLDSADAVDLLFLAVGGFLIGSLAYTGWFTTRYEPEAKPGYLVIGAGAGLVVFQNTWLQFSVEASSWYLGAEMLGFTLVAAGLTLIVWERRRRRK